MKGKGGWQGRRRHKELAPVGGGKEGRRLGGCCGHTRICCHIASGIFAPLPHLQKGSYPAFTELRKAGQDPPASMCVFLFAERCLLLSNPLGPPPIGQQAVAISRSYWRTRAEVPMCTKLKCSVTPKPSNYPRPGHLSGFDAAPNRRFPVGMLVHAMWRIGA